MAEWVRNCGINHVAYIRPCSAATSCSTANSLAGRQQDEKRPIAMSETPSPAQSSAWRTAKACQECRKRKIKCNGVEPCKTCQLRNTPCIYRDIVRQRKRKQRDRPSDNDGVSQSTTQAPRPDSSARHQSPGLPHKPSGKYTFYNSVSATHMASPSCKVQLYYGPTAHFALMQQVYRDLMSNQAAQAEEPQGEVEEAGAGLDLFSFRRIFFGTPSEAPDLNKSASMSGLPTTMFLSYGLANVFLQRFLSTLFALMPVRSKDFFQRQLDQLYQPSPHVEPDASYHALVLLALAMGSLGTEHYAWGDVLLERAKASSAALDEVVNLQTVQISLFIISIPSISYGIRVLTWCFLARSLPSGTGPSQLRVHSSGHRCSKGNCDGSAQGGAKSRWRDVGER